ncbi:hypothetical protein EPN90_03115 [Patescibacteria group bacterium]|nr:MAG: hypothetical protein EPN90_03115 [Patescibacteria group bacterium]
MASWQKWFWWGLAAAALAAGIFLRLHNASVWNPYWGYDGGAHLRYAEILATAGRLPTLEETYVAWHEPLFYAIAAPIITLSGGAEAAKKTLPYLPAAFGLLTFFLLGWWSFKRTKQAAAPALTLLLTAALPVALTASTFFSNEGLAHLLLLLALFYAANQKDPDKKSSALAAGVIIGLALLTKVTAFLGLFSIVVWQIYRFASRLDLPRRSNLGKLLISTLLLAVTALAIASPWLVTSAKQFGGPFTNTFEAKKAPGILPPNFFTTLDSNIFFSPFWPAGSNSFWSVVFAATVTDYDDLLKNPDQPSPRLRLAQRQLSPRLRLAQRAVWLGAALAPVFLFALARFLLRARKKLTDGDGLLAIFFLGSLAALIANTVRFGSLERGNAKPIFILSAVLLAVLITAAEITDTTLPSRLRRALTIYTLVVGAAFAANGLMLGWV